MSVTQETPVVPASVPAGPRTWVRRIVTGGQIVETCEAWCTASHATDDCGNLDDLTHVGATTEMFVDTADHWSDGAPVTLPLPVLRANVCVDPYSEDPRRNRPFVSFEPAQDDVMDALDPDEFAAVIAQIRAHCDRLELVLADLVQARAQYGPE